MFSLLLGGLLLVICVAMLLGMVAVEIEGGVGSGGGGVGDVGDSCSGGFWC